jgi:hypothetical protein
MYKSFLHWICLTVLISPKEALYPPGPLLKSSTPYYGPSQLDVGMPFEKPILGATTDRYGSVYATGYEPNMETSANPQQDRAGIKPMPDANGLNSIGMFEANSSARHVLFYADADPKAKFIGLFSLTKNASIEVREKRGMNGTASMIFVADKGNKRVIGLEILQSGPPRKFVQCEPQSLQMLPQTPSSLLVTPETAYTYFSGQSIQNTTKDGHGQLWLCLPNGSVQLQLKDSHLGRVTGIALHPCESYLYIAESWNINGRPAVNRVWRLLINQDTGSVTNTTDSLFLTLPSDVGGSIEDIQFDTRGQMYIVIKGRGLILIYSPTGQVVTGIQSSFSAPSALAFSKNRLFIFGQCSLAKGGLLDSGCVDYYDLPKDTTGSSFARQSLSYSGYKAAVASVCQW